MGLRKDWSLNRVDRLGTKALDRRHMGLGVRGKNYGSWRVPIRLRQLSTTREHLLIGTLDGSIARQYDR